MKLCGLRPLYAASFFMLTAALVCAPQASLAQGACPAIQSVPISGRAVPAMADLEQKVGAIMQQMCIPGLAIAVAKDGRLVYARGFGYANVANHAPMAPDLMFRMASISKSFTGVGVYKLVQDGAVDLDAKVFGPGGYLPNFGPPPGHTMDPRLAAATVRNFLEMSVVWSESLHRPNNGRRFEAPRARDQMLRQQMAYDLAFAPGANFKYTNADFDVLAAIIEARNPQHLPYEAYMKQVIFNPLGMTHVFVGDQSSGQATPYSDAPLRPLPSSTYRVIDGAGGWVANSIDLMRFMVALRGLGSAPSPLTASTEQTFVGRPQNPAFNGKKNYWVSGWDSVECPICAPGALTDGLITDGVKATWVKGGDLPGTITSYQSSPNGLAFVILINQHAEKAMPMLYRNLLIPTVRRIQGWPAYDLFSEFPG